MKEPIEICPCCNGRGYCRGRYVGFQITLSEVRCKRCKGTGRIKRTAA